MNFVFGACVYLVARVALRRTVATGVALALTLGFAAGSGAKMAILGVPLLPWDLAFVGSLTSMTAFLEPAIVVLACGLVVSVAVLVIASKGVRQRVFRRVGFLRAALAAAVAAGVWTFAVLATPAPLFSSAGMHNIVWDQAANFSNYGPYYTFLSNVKFVALDPPDIQAREQAAVIDAAGVTTMARQGAPAEAPNVVIILSESFTRLPEQIFGEKYRCLASAPQSRLITPAWGGYTANVEFEVLTGYPNALFPVGAVPYQMYSQRPVAHALPRVLGERGYRSTALHTYEREFFSRPQAYASLGFDRYLGIEDIGPSARRGQYVTDQVLFDNIERSLDEEGEQPAFVHAVTMMAHMPYNVPGRYPTRSGLRDALPQALSPHASTLVHYASVLLDHEEMLCGFFDRLKQRKRRTLVLVYGDHYPTFGDMGVYRDIHRAIAPAGVPFDLVQHYSRPPVALFDSETGFVPLPDEITAYNLGTALLQAAGLDTPSVWGMPHKLQRRTIVERIYVAQHQASYTGGIGVDPKRADEYKALAAHAYATFVEPPAKYARQGQH